MKKILLILAVTLFLACGDGGTNDGGNIYYTDIPDAVKKVSKYNVGVVKISESVKQTTPLGITHNGFKNLNSTQLSTMDSALTDLETDVIQDGFKQGKFKPHSQYIVYTPEYECIPSPIERVPAFLINTGAEYDGSDFDQYYPDGRYRTPVAVRDANGNITKYLYSVPDGVGVVFAPEMVLSSGNYGGVKAAMYVCSELSILKTAVKHGGDHIHAFNYAYNEDNRDMPPYDGWTYVNCSTYHTTGVYHPLFPRLDRCVSSSALEVSKKELFIKDGNETSLVEGEQFKKGRVLRLVK